MRAIQRQKIEVQSQSTARLIEKININLDTEIDGSDYVVDGNKHITNRLLSSRALQTRIQSQQNNGVSKPRLELLQRLTTSNPSCVI